MLKVNVLPADTYIVFNKTILSEPDRKHVIMLYQPIIGSLAVSLYFTLWSYLDRNEIGSAEWTHHHLVTNMGIKLDDIMEAREKLEGIGLLKTYYKKGNVNNFIYELYSPLTPSDFLMNPILSVSLYNNIGKKEFEKIMNHFKIPKVNLTDYEDITCLFSDVFAVEHKTAFQYETTAFKNKNRRDISFISKIDLTSILGMIPEEMLSIRSINKEVKDLIYKLAFIYHLDDDSLLSIIRNSLNEKRMIDKKKLRMQARHFYEFENGGKMPSLIYKNQPEYLKRQVEDVSKRSKMIYTFENTSPYVFLASKYKGSRPPKTELAILEYLAVDLDLKPGVINVIIDYVLRINQNKLTKNFVLTVAAQFKKEGIETVEDAMLLAEKEYQSRKKMVTKKTLETVKQPSWLNKEFTKKELDGKEKEEMSKMLEGFR